MYVKTALYVCQKSPICVCTAEFETNGKPAIAVIDEPKQVIELENILKKLLSWKIIELEHIHKVIELAQMIQLRKI